MYEICHFISQHIDISSLNYLVAHVEFQASKACEMCDGVYKVGEIRLGIQIAWWLDYRLCISIDDLSTWKQCSR